MTVLDPALPAPILLIWSQLHATPILLAILLGGAIGIERETHGRPAGLRTHILVCLSSTMVIAVSRAVAEGPMADAQGVATLVFDPNRMGAGIVTGIGFLGGATVLRSGDFVRGLTTAACIWFVAGLGIVLGSGNYLLGTVSTAAVLFVLIVVNRLGDLIKPTIYRRLVVTTGGLESSSLIARVRAFLEEERIRMIDVSADSSSVDEKTELTFYLSLKNDMQSPSLVERIVRIEGVRQARWRQIS